jgi:hypothetical protein
MLASALPIVLGLTEAGVLLLVFFVIGSMGWFPTSPDEPPKYCERIRTGMIKQPANTWSNLGFILCGLAILIWIGQSAAHGKSANPMATQGGWSIVYGMAVVWLGPGSMFLHACQKQWGGVFDNLSMNMYLSWFLLYDLSRVFGGPSFAVALVIWLLVNGALGAWIWLAPKFDKLGIIQFAVLIGLLLLVEILGIGLGVIHPSIGKIHRQVGWLIAGALIFGAAFGIWIYAGNSWSKACKPDSLLQGHAAWHLLGAVATVPLFVYLRSETVG